MTHTTREYRKMRGLCIMCGLRPSRENRQTCFECALKRSEYNRQRYIDTRGGLLPPSPGRKRQYDYIVYDLDGNEIFRGSFREVMGHIHICHSSVYHAAGTNRIISGKYRIGKEALPEEVIS